MGQWAKPDLSYLAFRIIQPNLLIVDRYHPQEAVYKNKEKLSDRF